MASQTAVLSSQLPISIGSVAPQGGGRIRLPHILSIGKDADLLSERAGILKAAGYPVRSAVPEEISDLVIAGSYNVAIYDQSLSDAEAVELAVCTHAVNPRAKLLLLAGSKPRPRFVERLFDVTAPTSDGYVALARCVRNLLSEAEADPATH